MTGSVSIGGFNIPTSADGNIALNGFEHAGGDFKKSL